MTLTLLDTGTTYPDAFDDDAGEYHYPSTGRGQRDTNEINATKNASRMGLPVFVVLEGPTSGLREVRRAWIDRWDDRRRVFLVSFAPSAEVACDVAKRPFVLTQGARPRRQSAVRVRSGQNRFRFAVLSRCDGECVVCGVNIDVLLEAAHLCGVQEGGSDDPRNGLALCRNHHRAFDSPVALFGIRPDSLEVVLRGGLTLASLGITRERISPSHAPHPEALAWAWSAFESHAVR